MLDKPLTKWEEVLVKFLKRKVRGDTPTKVAHKVIEAAFPGYHLHKHPQRKKVQDGEI